METYACLLAQGKISVLPHNKVHLSIPEHVVYCGSLADVIDMCLPSISYQVLLPSLWVPLAAGFPQKPRTMAPTLDPLSLHLTCLQLSLGIV